MKIEQDSMSASLRKLIIIVIIGLVFLCAWYFRHREGRNLFQPAFKVEFRGPTMGTYYAIKYLDLETRNFQSQVDSILNLFSLSLSTYIPNSEISRFNRQDTLWFESPYFLPVLEKSREVFLATGGAFDPTVMPLVNAWGFGPGTRKSPGPDKIDSLKNLVGFDKIKWDNEKVYKLQPNVQLDFSAVAKGYGVDIIAEYLQKQGILNLMVDIGGEIVCRGKNEKGKTWLLGIPYPLPGDSSRIVYATIELKNRAIATSGNYQNYYEKNGKIVSHTISPFTGHPVRHELLSASVLADNCITADAFATGFMVLGVEKAREILNENSGLEGYLIYRNEAGNLDSYWTEGLKRIIEELGNDSGKDE